MLSVVISGIRSYELVSPPLSLLSVVVLIFDSEVSCSEFEHATKNMADNIIPINFFIIDKFKIHDCVEVLKIYVATASSCS